MQNAQNASMAQVPAPAEPEWGPYGIGKRRSGQGGGASGLQVVEAKFDRAIASALSAAVYTDNVWMLQTLSEPWEKTSDWRMAPGAEDPKQIERSCLLKEFCKPVEGVRIEETGSAVDPITNKLTPFYYKNGVYFFGDLGCAALVERKRMDGGTVMELSFRSTEKETTGNPNEDKKNLVGGFFMSAYKDLDGHYERHRRLISETVRIVNERIKAGEDITLQVSGHSLGGSMAEIFLQKDAKNIAPGHVQGCTFGSPGIGDKQGAFSMLVQGCVRLIKTQLGLTSGNARKESSLLADNPEAYAKATSFESAFLPKAPLVQYINPRDPIPKIGLLGGYKSSGRVYFSTSVDRDAATGEIIKGSLRDISKHSALAYEASRAFSFMKSAKSNTRSGCPDREIIQATLNKVARANEHATALHERAAHLFDQNEPDRQLSARIECVIKAAREREGMITKQSPNSRADDIKLSQAMDSIGDKILEKLRNRRSAVQNAPLLEAWGATRSMASPKMG